MPRPFVHVDVRLDGVTAGASVALPDDAVHHLRGVLRLEPGDPVVLTDGAGATLAARLERDVAVATADVRRRPARRPAIHVLQAIPKGRRLDDVVRTCTELGVDRITPVRAERSVPRLHGGRATKAVGRWQAVARAAAEQARNPWRPRVDAPATLGRLDLAGASVLVAHVGAGGLRSALAALPRHAPRVACAIGPEGGWTDDELAALDGRTVGLGPTVLRTEHAAAALVAVVAHHLGRTDSPPQP